MITSRWRHDNVTLTCYYCVVWWPPGYLSDYILGKIDPPESLFYYILGRIDTPESLFYYGEGESAQDYRETSSPLSLNTNLTLPECGKPSDKPAQICLFDYQMTRNKQEAIYVKDTYELYTHQSNTLGEIYILLTCTYTAHSQHIYYLLQTRGDIG